MKSSTSSNKPKFRVKCNDFTLGKWLKFEKAWRHFYFQVWTHLSMFGIDPGRVYTFWVDDICLIKAQHHNRDPEGWINTEIIVQRGIPREWYRKLVPLLKTKEHNKRAREWHDETYGARKLDAFEGRGIR